jgi:hypothetical protein
LQCGKTRVFDSQFDRQDATLQKNRIVNWLIVTVVQMCAQNIETASKVPGEAMPVVKLRGSDQLTVDSHRSQARLSEPANAAKTPSSWSISKAQIVR